MLWFLRAAVSSNSSHLLFLKSFHWCPTRLLCRAPVFLWDNCLKTNVKLQHAWTLIYPLNWGAEFIYFLSSVCIICANRSPSNDQGYAVRVVVFVVEQTLIGIYRLSSSLWLSRESFCNRQPNKTWAQSWTSGFEHCWPKCNNVSATHQKYIRKI